MWTISGFADEISPDLDEQIRTLESEGISHLELRGVWGKNVLDLSDEELDRIRETLAVHNIGVSSIGSPIGKIPISDPFEPHLERFRRALYVAQVLGAPYIRIFSFFLPQGEPPEKYRDEVLRRMSALAAETESSNAVLLHENEKEIYGDVPERCLDILKSVNSPKLRAAWDAANFVQCGITRPFDKGFGLLEGYIKYIHVKDALNGSGQVTPAGQGDGQLREMLRALNKSGFEGFFSLEPHLSNAGRFSGFSGPERWVEASRAFKALLAEQQISWN